MKAKIKPRIQLENREPLWENIPLETPWVIFVDPSDLCNFKCKFCPTGKYELMKKVGRPLKVMSFNSYERVINEICKFDKPIKVLRLYKDGEPLMNPYFAEMIAHAKESGCCESVDTTTNGSLLCPELNRKIVKAGLDRINISIEGVNEIQYKEFSNYNINYDVFLDNIADLYDNKEQLEMIIKINGDEISEEDKSKFLDLYGDICDGIFIEHTMNCWNNFDMKDLKQNEEVGIYGQPIKEVDICPYVFYSISINSDLSVSLCFLDWNRKLMIGNLKEESLKSIWNGHKLFTIRNMFLKGLRKFHSICGKCSQLSHGLPVDLDPYREELFNKIRNDHYGLSNL
jgi:MoaA/NifB/PqqE/SkfB family radical SAM enzyme